MKRNFLIWHEAKFYPSHCQAFKPTFFQKIEKANGPSSNEDFLWYETSTNNKQLQLQQFFYRISSWLVLSHISALWSRDPVPHRISVWHYDQVKASALDQGTSFKRLIHEIVYHQRNRYMYQHCYREIHFQTKVIFNLRYKTKNLRYESYLQ